MNTDKASRKTLNIDMVPNLLNTRKILHFYPLKNYESDDEFGFLGHFTNGNYAFHEIYAVDDLNRVLMQKWAYLPNIHNSMKSFSFSMN